MRAAAAIIEVDAPELLSFSSANLFSWDPTEALALIGINYAGLFDDLAFFNRALTAAEVEEIFALDGGIAKLRP